MSTYNHAKFIRQCLQSLVEQQTTFPFEIVVSDDGSRDGTDAIVREFGDRYPGVVRAFVQPQNIGGTPNYFFVHGKARGVYVAHVDGDDYALPGKLQKLHDCLEQHPGVNIAWHRMKILDQNGRWAVGMPFEPDTAATLFGGNRLSMDRLLLFYSITGYHSSSMYRASARTLVNRDQDTLDYFISLSFCETGDGYHIDEPLGVYRWFVSESSLTKVKHGSIVNDALLDTLRHYGAKYPKYRKSISAHATMKALFCLYLRNPYWAKYAALAVEQRAVPRAADLRFICRLFDAGRGKRLGKKFAESERHPLDAGPAAAGAPR